MLKDKKPPPPCLPGYEKINRYWDPTLGVFAAKILPGEFYVSTRGEVVVTVLGSCISACVRDRNLGIGGMNHFMLPSSKEQDNTFGASTRYGNWAMEYLINEILKAGGKRSQLEIKVFGGGKVLESMNAIDVGQRNIDFIMQYIRDEGIKLVAQDVGDIYPRKVLFFTDTGSAKVKKLITTRNDVIVERESSYQKQLVTKPVDGDIELF